MKWLVDKSLVLGIITIGLTIFAIWSSTDNIFNSPNFILNVEELEKNEEGKKPVDEIVQVIYDKRNSQQFDAQWLRDKDREYVIDLKERFSPEDAWVLDRVYYNTEMYGLSEKITLTNNGNRQAHDVIIQIEGHDNFKLVDYACPEIMSEEQIIKDLGKNYIVSISRMSIKLDCEIIINSVGDDGIKQVIVTANESLPKMWPDDLIKEYRDRVKFFNIFLYLVIGILAMGAYVLFQNELKKNRNRENKFSI